MPFGGYATFDECVDDNQDKDDPQAFCAWLEQDAAGRGEETSMETRGFTIEQRERADGRLNVSGRAVVFDSLSEDLGGFREKFARGSLDKTLSERRDVGLLYSHDSAAVLASTRAGNLQLHADDAGLRIDADLDLADPDVQRLDAKLQAGTVDKMSFGFRPVNDRWDERDEDGRPVRTVTEAQLIETSAVWLPAYQATNLEGRAGIGDLTVGAIATMPAEVRDHLVAELRDGQPLSKATRKTVDQALASLHQLRSHHADDVDSDTQRRVEQARDRAETAGVEVREHNLGQWLEAMIHLDFTTDADMLFGDGLVSREERKAMSAAIGDALAAFTSRLQADAPQLFNRALFDGPPADGAEGREQTSMPFRLRARARLLERMANS